MRQFEFIVQDAMGIHARPVAELAVAAKRFLSQVNLRTGEKEADIKNPLALMRLAVKQGEKVKIVAEGEDEEQVIAQMKVLIVEIGLV